MKDDHPTQLPVARTEQLIVKEVDLECLVYHSNLTGSANDPGPTGVSGFLAICG